MSTPRRRILRPTRAAAAVPPRHHLQVEKCRTRLERERATLARWMVRLKRSFHAVEKQQRRISGLERQLARLEQSNGQPR